MEKQAKGQFVKVHLGLVLLLMIVVFTVRTTSAHATPSAQTTAAATVSAPEQHIFVGKVADTQAFIALGLTDTKVVGFVCDGTKNDISFWHWFSGDAVNNSIELTTSDGESLDAQIAEDTVTGTVTLHDNKPHAFTADLATAPAGLYRVEFTLDGVDYIGGWIVLGDKEVRGGVGDKKGQKQPITGSFYSSESGFNSTS